MIRLYNAVCEAIEAKAHMYRQEASEPDREVDIPDSQAELADQIQREELDQDAHRDGSGHSRIGFTAGVASTGGLRRRSPTTQRFITPQRQEDQW